MAHAVQWVALARRTGVQSRNRNSTGTGLDAGGPPRAGDLAPRRRPRSGRHAECVPGHGPGRRRHGAHRARPGGAAIPPGRAHPLAAAPPGVSSSCAPGMPGAPKSSVLSKSPRERTRAPGRGEKKPRSGCMPAGVCSLEVMQPLRAPHASSTVSGWLTASISAARGERNRRDSPDGNRAAAPSRGTGTYRPRSRRDRGRVSSMMWLLA
jgi:hypothetical protein